MGSLVLAVGTGSTWAMRAALVLAMSGLTWQEQVFDLEDDKSLARLSAHTDLQYVFGAIFLSSSLRAHLYTYIQLVHLCDTVSVPSPSAGCVYLYCYHQGLSCIYAPCEAQPFARFFNILHTVNTWNIEPVGTKLGRGFVFDGGQSDSV